MTSVPVCDHKSVGILIGDGDGSWLMFRRVRFPIGIAPAAGHVDGHGGFAAAARAEVGEELGLQVRTLRQITGGWRPYPCRRPTGRVGLTGHLWAVYEAETSGQLRPDPAEAAGACWCTRAELQHLADRTVAHAHGVISPAQFSAEPGLEPVWLEWLHTAGLITVELTDLHTVDGLARRGDLYTPAPASRPCGTCGCAAEEHDPAGCRACAVCSGYLPSDLVSPQRAPQDRNSPRNLP